MLTLRLGAPQGHPGGRTGGGGAGNGAGGAPCGRGSLLCPWATLSDPSGIKAQAAGLFLPVTHPQTGAGGDCCSLRIAGPIPGPVPGPHRGTALRDGWLWPQPWGSAWPPRPQGLRRSWLRTNRMFLPCRTRKTVYFNVPKCLLAGKGDGPSRAGVRGRQLTGL